MSETTTAPEQKIIWKSAGLHLTQKNKDGWLMVTPDLLRAYFTRPEIHPVDESCETEHMLFERLMETPEAEITADELGCIKDEDARENYQVILRFRDHLIEHKTLEKAYLALFNSDVPPVIPPVFIGHIVHLILSNMLSKERDPFILRAAEIFFREQKVTTEEGQIMFADAEVVELYSETGGLGGLGSLLAESGTKMQQVSLDVLTRENAELYWERADQFNFAIDYRFTEPGPDALARVLEKWVDHLLGVSVRIQAMQSISDEKWSWHIGLDSASTKILNELYNGNPIEEETLANIAGLFRLEFRNKSDVMSPLRGKAVYLGLAMSKDKIINMKPQNILVNLPIRDPN